MGSQPPPRNEQIPWESSPSSQATNDEYDDNNEQYTKCHSKTAILTKLTNKNPTSQSSINSQRMIRRVMGSLLQSSSSLVLLIFLLLMDDLGAKVQGNILPQFLLSDGQSEIVLRLKEGPATPVGSMIYTLKGIDRDGDPLTFGLKGQIANELLRIENRGRDTANLYLKKELDREVRGDDNCFTN
jgi:hypothetical protein